MKKIFSLVCATLLVMSVSATEFVGSHVVREKAAVETAKSQSFTIPQGQKKVVREVAKQATKAQLPADAKVRYERVVAAPTTINTRKSPAAVQDGIITVDYVQGIYLGDQAQLPGLWELQFFDGEDFTLDVAIVSADGTHICGNFELEEGDGFIVLAPGDTVDIASGKLDITWSTDIKGYVFAMNVTGNDAKTYTMNYSCPEEDVFAVDYMSLLWYQWLGIPPTPIELDDFIVIPTGETIQVAIEGYSFLYYFKDGDFYADGRGDNCEITVNWFPKTEGSPLGKYTDAADFWAEYCLVVIGDKVNKAKNVELEVTEANDTIYMDVNMLLRDGIVYHAVLKNYTITPKSQIDVEVATVSLNKSNLKTKGLLIFQGEGPAYMLNLGFYVKEGIIGEYTEAEMYNLNNDKGSYIGDKSTASIVPIVNGNFKIEQSNDCYKLTGSLICQDENQYNFVIDCGILTGDTIELDTKGYSSLEYIEDEGDYFATYECDQFLMAVDWFPKTAGSPVGTYTVEDDFYMDYCQYIAIASDGAATRRMARKVEMEVSVANDTTYMDVNMLLYDGNVYHALLKHYTITPKSVVTVEFDEIDLNTDYLNTDGYIEFFGTGETHEVNLGIYVNEGVVGEYTEADVEGLNDVYGSYIGDLSTKKIINIVSATIQIEESEKSYKLTASLICTDEIQYNFVIDGATIEVEVVELDAKGYTPLSYFEDGGDYYAVYEGDAFAMSIDWYPKTPGTPVGFYDEPTDFYLKYCQLIEVTSAGAVERKVQDVELEVTEANDTIYMDVKFLTTNNTIYHAVLKNYTPTAKSEKDITFEAMEVSTELMSQGALVFVGQSREYMVQLLVVVDEGIVGEYTEQDLASFNNPKGGSFIGDMTTMYIIPALVGNFKIEESGDSYKLTGSLVCEDDVQYNFVIDGNTTAIENVDANAVKAVKTIQNGQLLIERNGVEYNVMGARVK